MNRDEIKPVWEAFKQQADQQDHWSNDQFVQLLEPHSRPASWTTRLIGGLPRQRILLNLGVSLLLIGISGC